MSSSMARRKMRISAWSRSLTISTIVTSSAPHRFEMWHYSRASSTMAHSPGWKTQSDTTSAWLSRSTTMIRRRPAVGRARAGRPGRGEGVWVRSVNNYAPAAAGVAPDRSGPLGPMEGVLARLDPLLTDPSRLTDEEFRQLVDFVRDGLLDPRARPERLRTLVPKAVPSGRPVLIFEFP